MPFPFVWASDNPLVPILAAREVKKTFSFDPRGLWSLVSDATNVAALEEVSELGAEKLSPWMIEGSAARIVDFLAGGS